MPVQPEPFWFRLFFSYPALSPLVWFVYMLVCAGLLFGAGFGMVHASFPHWLLLLLMLGAIWPSRRLLARLERVQGPIYGGWMPSLQKTVLFQGFLGLMALVAYGFWISILLGVLLFVPLGFYAWRFLPREKRRQGLIESFTELTSSTRRVEAPGIHQFERLCLWACVLSGLCAGVALLDMFVTTGHPTYTVRILSKEIQNGSKGSRTYLVRLSGWRPGRLISQPVFRQDFEFLQPEQSYELRTRRGLFGSERIETWALAPARRN